jgi:hypothetical protein
MTYKKGCLHGGPERYAWLYKQNPFGTAHTWLAACEDTGEVVGCCSLYPSRFYVNDRVLKVGVVVDYGVDAKHRVFGPAVSIVRAITTSLKNVESEFDISFGYPSRDAAGAIQRAGYTLIGASADWVKIIRSKYKIAEYIKIKPLANIIGLIIDKISFMYDSRYEAQKSEDLVTDTLDKCDERFDVFWEKMKSKYTIVPDQSAAYLNWRYSDCKTAQYRYFCLFDKSKKDLKGFIIYTIKNNGAIIKNIFPAHGEYLLNLLVAFSGNMRSDKVNFITVSYYGNDSFVKEIKKINFIEREIKRDYALAVREDLSNEYKDDLRNKDNYYFFYG